MDMQDILRLVQAGYTKEDIDKMTAPVAAPAPAPAADPTPAPAADPTPAPAADPEPAPAPAPAADPITDPQQPTLKDMMLAISKLTSAIQANAIANSVIPGGPGQGPTAEDAIAEIIRPTLQERKG